MVSSETSSGVRLQDLASASAPGHTATKPPRPVKSTAAVQTPLAGPCGGGFLRACNTTEESAGGGGFACADLLARHPRHPRHNEAQRARNAACVVAAGLLLRRGTPRAPLGEWTETDPLTTELNLGRPTSVYGTFHWAGESASALQRDVTWWQTWW